MWPTVQVLPEKEAKAIASQMFDGLAYLNGPSRRIIHYDLKPANILFDQLGQVKITVSAGYCQTSMSALTGTFTFVGMPFAFLYTTIA